MDKRRRKTSSFDVSEIGLKLHGDNDADVTFVSWGSTKLVILEAMSMLGKQKDLKSNFLQIIFMEPFPSEQVSKILENSKKTILIENNQTGQLGDLIRQKTGILIEDRIFKYNGRQFFRDELVELIEGYL